MRYRLVENPRMFYPFDFYRYDHCLILDWLDNSSDYERILFLKEVRAWVFENLECLGECAVDQKTQYHHITYFYFMNPKQMVLFKLRWS